LFNIGACCSDIASTSPLETEEGLKTAAKLYQQAAGCFSYIRDHALTATRSDCTSDFYPDTLTCLIAVMLAQAQEVFYLKAVDNKFKDATIAKLVKQCSDFYAEAMKTVQSESLKDLQKAWLPILAGKQALFHALSEYHRGESDLAEQKVGESLARFGKALDLIKTAEQRGGKELNLKSYSARIQAAYDKAKKDNEFVYHDRVPEYKNLAVIEGASLAKVTAVKYPVSEDFRDLFATLVPMAVHNGLQTFKAKRMEVLNMEIGKLRQATELMNTALATWNLPAAIEDVGGKNLVPQSLLDKSQAIKDKGGIAYIDRMMSELVPLMERNTDILNESKRQLAEEEASDNELRASMKEKWTRTASRQLTEYLHSEVKQYDTIMENAAKANKVIETKYAKSKDGIQLLSRAPHEIGAALPAATATGALQNTHVVRELRRLMEQVEGLRNVREVIESEMKGLDNDALNAKLVAALQRASGLDEHSVIQGEVDELVAPMRKQVRENIQEQEKLLGFIEKANSDFVKESVHNETSKLREEMLRNLAVSADSFKELHSHLEEGNKVSGCCS
jgi:programmed cell death 6-interacting protein